MVFKNPVANVGNAYNTDTGEFEALVDGTYFLTATLCVPTALWTHFHVVHYDVTLSMGQVGDSAWGRCNTVSAATYMLKGSNAWIKFGLNGGNLKRITNHSFTAVLLNTYETL